MDGLEFLLTEALDLCRKGKCKYITSTELIMLTEIIHKPETMGREDAAKYLGISLNKFHELRTAGLIAEPRKRKGFKEKEYYTSDLCKYLETNKL
jgi:hypothetical protein